MYGRRRLVSRIVSEDWAEQLLFLKAVTGRALEPVPFGPPAAGYALGAYDGYPRVGHRTLVTFGLARQGGSMWRGLPLGCELVLTHRGDAFDLVELLKGAVIENGHRRGGPRAATFHRGEWCVVTGIRATPIFTGDVSATPELLVRKKFSSRYVNFWYAIAIDDRELRQYDRSVRGLIDELQDPVLVAKYPRPAR